MEIKKLMKSVSSESRKESIVCKMVFIASIGIV